MYNICKYKTLILFCFSFCNEVFEVLCVCVPFIWNYKYRKRETNFAECPDMMNARIDGLQHEIQAMKSELQTLKNQRSNQGTAHASVFILSK